MPSPAAVREGRDLAVGNCELRDPLGIRGRYDDVGVPSLRLVCLSGDDPHQGINEPRYGCVKVSRLLCIRTIADSRWPFRLACRLEAVAVESLAGDSSHSGTVSEAGAGSGHWELAVKEPASDWRGEGLVRVVRSAVMADEGLRRDCEYGRLDRGRGNLPDTCRMRYSCVARCRTSIH